MQLPPWYNKDGHPATNVAFDASFAGYAPKGMMYWFNGFSSLKGLTGLENLNASCATNAFSMFKDCTSLTALDLSNHDMRNLYRTQSMFQDCTSLTSVNLGGVNMPGVRILVSMFYGCSALTSLNLSGVQVPDVKWMNNMFRNCTSLTKLDLRGLGTKNCERAKDMFNGCSNLMTIVVSDAFVLSPELITEKGQDTSTDMFKGCTSLVGGRGTKFDPAKAVDKTFAKIDGGTASPGYFTAPPVPVTYVDAEGNGQTTNAYVVESSETRMTWNLGWYVVTNEVTIKGGADCTNAVHLILADTGKLTINNVAMDNAGIGVTGANSLAIYGQALGTGALTVMGGTYGAGIGGGESQAGSNITINGGTVTANGGDSSAGIGGGYDGDGSNIRINGGMVTATGGDGGAGIGGGLNAAGSNIMISGGKVTANGGGGGVAGIGSGERDTGEAPSNIRAADDVIVKAGASKNPTAVIAHLSTQDIAGDLDRKQYATAALLVKVTVADVANATAKVYANEVEITERPAKIEYGTAFDVVYTADAGYMFPGGYKTFETNLTANAAAITVAVPAGQQPVEATTCEACLTFSADAAFGIKMRKNGTSAEPKLEYSTDQIYWSKFDLGNGAVAGADNKLYLRGTDNQQFSKGLGNYYAFTNTADSAATAIACSGNIMTLLDYETVAKGEEPTMGENAFNLLFCSFAALTTAPELPATNLADQCYGYMFQDCTALTTAPALPATNLTEGCYTFMFKNCASLTSAPVLPATKPVTACYSDMFSCCTSLTAAPALPATNLAEDCYKNMFQGCTSLTAAPELSAMNLTKNCYMGMFQGCTSLTDVPALPATNLAYQCYAVMFKGCTALEVNTNGTGKAWSIPSDAATSAATATQWNTAMFKETAGSITNAPTSGKPTPGVTYYVKSAIKRVTVVVPEVEGATAELYAFDVNGGWRAVETNAVPSNATVRVVWTAADDKVLTGADAVNVYEWQTSFGPVVGGETAPAPTVGDDGESEVAVRIDTRATKRYFRAEDILPVWYAMGEEAKVKGEGEQSWTILVKNAVTNDMVRWTPTKNDTYTLTMADLAPATIILATPVEVTTNGLEVAKTTVKVTDESGNPLVAQTEGEFAGKIIVPSNSTVKVVWTATGSGKYFLDGTTTYTQTFEADKDVNAVSEAVTVPEEPKEPSVKVGVVGQRYPWDGKLDVQYWAKNTPNKGWRIKVTVTLPDGKEESETVDALSGKNAMVFDMRAAFGEVTVKGVKVSAKLVEAPPPR